MSAAIFISYRRSDAAGHAGRLFDRLTHWFDDETLFYDLDSIGAGDTFPQRLVNGIESAKAVLVLIGPGWVEELNTRCARAEHDFVRSEVEHALRCHAAPGGPKVIPVLLGGAMAPSADTLDANLRSTMAPLLALDMHAFQGKNDDWNHQFVRLRKMLRAVPGVPPPRFRVPAGTEPPPFHAVGQSVSRHFSDPDGRLSGLQKALEAAGTEAVVSPVAIHGMGGVGKTQLALKYSHDYRDRYAGVWWLRAETDATLQLDALDACRAAGAPVGEGEAPALAFKRWLDNSKASAPPWLLVFDNAEDPAALRPFLPERGGHHVLVTSRNPAWGGIAKPMATGLWSAEQGVDFLAQRLAHHPGASDRSALRELAEALGGLPLAMEQAAGFLDETGMSVADYLAQVHSHDAAPLLLDEGRGATGYERSVLATLAIAFPRLDEAAARLLRLLAFCAPDPVPESLFTDWPAELPPALAAAAAQPVAWNKAVAGLRRFGLVERTTLATGSAALQVHRLTQEVVRHQLADAQADAGAVLGLLCSALPLDAGSPAHWLIYSVLAPHVALAERLAEQVSIDRRKLCDVLSLVATYFQRGLALYGTARAGFERALALTRGDLGDEHSDTLTAMNNLALVLLDQGDLDGARDLQQQVLKVSRRVLGDEHPLTLTSMGNLALTLSNQGETGVARELQEQALIVSRRMLGDEHPSTLREMSNLAGTLRDQGELGGARELQEQVLVLTRRVLGEERPEVLTAMSNLACTLSDQGKLGDARKLQEQALTLSRGMLGDEHPDTLREMGNLANTLKYQGDLGGVRELEEGVLAVRRRVLGEEHFHTLIAMGNLAWTLGAQGDLAGARKLQEHVLAARRRVLGEEHPDTLSSMNNLANTLWQAGERTAAVDLMHRVAVGTGARLGADHPHAVLSGNAVESMRATLAATELLPGATTP